MQKFHFVSGIIFCLLCSIMTSCGNNDPSNSSLDKKAKKIVEKYAKYLLDNYRDGDVVIFQNEEGVSQEFAIKENSVKKLTWEDDPEGEEEEEGDYYCQYDIHTTLQYDRNTKFEIIMSCCSFAQKVPTEYELMIDMGINKFPRTADHTISNDTITIREGRNTAILVKNIGLVKVTSGEHSWELVR